MVDFRYEINAGKVAHEIIDGDVIALHSDTGFYFSLSNGAVRIWQWIAEGASWGEIRDAFEPLTAEQTVALDSFGEQLASDQLVSKVAAGGAIGLPRGEVRFELPKMEKYGDMQELLLIDPIHEVHETGWPKRGA